MSVHLPSTAAIPLKQVSNASGLADSLYRGWHLALWTGTVCTASHSFFFCYLVFDNQFNHLSYAIHSDVLIIPIRSPRHVIFDLKICQMAILI